VQSEAQLSENRRCHEQKRKANLAMEYVRKLKKGDGRKQGKDEPEKSSQQSSTQLVLKNYK